MQGQGKKKGEDKTFVSIRPYLMMAMQYQFHHTTDRLWFRCHRNSHTGHLRASQFHGTKDNLLFPIPSTRRNYPGLTDFDPDFALDLS